MPYDTSKDFATVSTLYKLELVLVAHPSVPAENLREFIALANAKPGTLNFAAGDNLGLTHLADIKEQLASQGLDPYVTTPEQFAQLVRSDTARFEKVIKAANIKIEK